MAGLISSMPRTHAEVLARAQVAAQRRVSVFGQDVQLRGEAAWRTDALSGRCWPDVPAHQLEVIREGMDPRCAWAAGRLEAAVALAQGAWLAGPRERTVLVQALEQLQADFCAHNPPGRGIQWACTMEVALRAQNLAVAHAMVAPWIAPCAARDGLDALAAHARFVEAHLEDAGRVPNNHLLGALAGLATLGLLWPGLVPGLADRACAGLDRALARQVHADGVSFEGSTAYHRLALELLLVPWVLRLQLGRDARLPRRLHRMFRVVRDFVDPAGEAPQLGDTDSGRGLVLCPRRATEQAYLLPLGAVLANDASLKFGGEVPLEELAWLLGPVGMARFSQMAPRAGARSRRSDAGGLHVLRAGTAVVAVSAGGHGQRGVGGHNHNDKLGFVLSVGGRLLVADPGSGSYTRSRQERDAFRSVRAHAVASVDGAEQAPLRRPFALTPAPRCRVTAFAHGEGWALLSAELDGRAAQARTLLLDARAQTLLLVDRVSADGAHWMELRFPLSGGEARVRLATPPERRAASGWLGCEAGEWAVEVGAAASPLGLIFSERDVGWQLAPHRHARGYGEVAPARCAVGRLRFSGARQVRTWITWRTGEGAWT